MGRIVFAAAFLASAALTAAQPPPTVTLKEALERAGARVEQYFMRAQSIVCLEIVRLQSLDLSMSPQGFARLVESELRLSWEPPKDGRPVTEAQSLRHLLKVNGHPPDAKDDDNCTAPEQQSKEPQPLSMLLPELRLDYDFWLVGADRVDGRDAVALDFKERKSTSVDVAMVKGKDDCVSFNVDGGMRGRIWIDVTSFDVLRLEQRLIGMIDIPLPRVIARRADVAMRWTMERWDTSITFKSVSFDNPEETLVLPSSLVSLRVTRGAAQPRLRTQTDYRNYRRFLTGARVVGD